MNRVPIIGFISPPAWFDPAPSEFPTVVEEAVQTQQAPLLLPDFDYRMESIASVQHTLCLCARSLQAIGCDLVAQVGSPFAWAGVASEHQARRRNEVLTQAAHAPTLMTGLALVDGLRSMDIQRVAVNCTYYEPDWRDGFATFLRMCGFDLVHVSTLAEQGLTAATAQMGHTGWTMTPECTTQSIRAVARTAQEAEAIVVTGAGTRTCALLANLEAQIGCPIVAADTILYWAIARALNLTLKPIMGRVAQQR